MKKKHEKETRFSEEEIGEAIKDGAVTKQYLADPQPVPPWEWRKRKER